MILRVALWAVVLLFPVSEIALAWVRRARVGIARHADQGSTRLLWLVIGASVAAAIVAQGVRAGRMARTPAEVGSVALTLLVLGLGLRWAAVITLGRFFTVDVAIHEGHTIVDRGVYRHVRHPSYAGLLLAFLGLGVSFANWLSIGLLVVPIGAAMLARIRKEEAALLQGLGPSYRDYCARTKRLVPGVY